MDTNDTNNPFLHILNSLHLLCLANLADNYGGVV